MGLEAARSIFDENMPSRTPADWRRINAEEAAKQPMRNDVARRVLSAERQTGGDPAATGVSQADWSRAMYGDQGKPLSAARTIFDEEIKNQNYIPGDEYATHRSENVGKTDLLDFMKGLPEAVVATGQNLAAGLAGRLTASPELARKMAPDVSERGQETLRVIGKGLEAVGLDKVLEGLGPTVATIPLGRFGGAPAAKPRVSYADFAKARAEAAPAPVAGPYTAAQASADGFTVTPRQARPESTLSNLGEGLAGSAKMEKSASIKNQKNTNRLIAQDLGLDPRKPITPQALADIRATEGGAYEAVKNSGVALKTDDAFKTAIGQLGGDFKAATKELPGLVDSPKIDNLIKSLSVDEMSPTAAVEAVKYLRAEAKGNLKAGFADPEKGALGMAQRKAANAIDDLIESNLSAAGKGDISSQYRAARVRIAKAHTADIALNDTTGNIDALKIGQLADRTQMSGGMQKVANFANAFSGSARSVDKMKDATTFGAADIAMGVLGHFAAGNPMGALAVGARPAARGMALSSFGQRLIIPSAAEAKGMSPSSARLFLARLSNLSGAAANDPNTKNVLSILSNRARND